MIIELLSYEFIQRAFIAGIFLGSLCATLGMFLVLRQNAMIGDGLSHISLGAVALGLFLGIYPSFIAIPMVILASLLILELSERAAIYGDAAISIVSALGVSAGVILASLSGGFNVDLLSYLFGNILTISRPEIGMSVILAVCVMIIIKLFYYDLVLATFNSELATTSGVNTKLTSRILVVLTAVTVVLAIRIVGVMLISALLVIPAVTALQLARSFSSALRQSIVISILSMIVGIGISIWLSLPTGATIVIVLLAIFGLAYGWKNIIRRK